MKKKELTPELKDELIKLAEPTIFSFKSIDTINHRPHPYTIGPKHVAYAADHCGGMLGQETIDKIPCAVPRCNLSYEEHTFDTVCFLSLKRNATNDEANADIKIINEFIMKHDLAEGFIMVETDERYRIGKPINKENNGKQE